MSGPPVWIVDGKVGHLQQSPYHRSQAATALINAAISTLAVSASAIPRRRPHLVPISGRCVPFFRGNGTISGQCQPFIRTFRPHLQGIWPEGVSTQTTGIRGGFSGAGPHPSVK